MAWRAVNPDVRPDGVSWAKALGGGVPIGAFWISDRIMDGKGTELSSIMDPGSHGSTYGGNPLCSTVALTVLKEIIGQNLPERAKKLGDEIRHEIESWSLPIITESRGLGLLIGIGLNTDIIPAEEGKTPAAIVVEALRKEGLLSVPAGPSTVRLLPPLNVTDDEVEQALSIIRRTLKQFGI